MKWNAVLMAALLAFGAAACSKDEGSEGEGEPESTATATESDEGEGAAEEGAEEGSAEEEGAGGKDRLVGTWVLDEKMVKELMEKNKAQGDSKTKAAQGLGAAMLMAMSPKFEFMEDGTSKMTMKNPMKEDAEPKVEEGTWEVTGEDGDSLTVKTTGPDGETEEFTATFDGEDKVSLEKEGDEMKMHLKRES